MSGVKGLKFRLNFGALVFKIKGLKKFRNRSLLKI